MNKKLSRFENLLSRKFIISLSCIIGGISLIKAGSFIPGMGAIITSCTGYLVAEGLIDIKNIEKISNIYKSDKADVSENIEKLESFDL
ncbi:MAG: hypothetical protein E7396_00900 [Ruminococcaceae bacterium]|nr:hypothetical protein [Oscillospiraceae bacterium]